MQDTENIVAENVVVENVDGQAAETAHLERVRERRLGLRRTMTTLEEASSAAMVGRPRQWREQMLPELESLREAWAAHISGTEGPGGLWEQVRADAPRLDGHLRRLRRDHTELTSVMEDLRRDLMDTDDDESRLGLVRNRLTALLVALARHRQRGADLIYEAYEHDIGGTG